METLPATPALPRICVNAFPKSGTHLALLLVAPHAMPQIRADGGEHGEWFGTFGRNSWSDIWMPTQMAINIVEGQEPGTYMKGHVGFKPEISKALFEMGTCMVFIYRDLRDVAVSMVHHIESDIPGRKHPEREKYLAMSTHEDRLLAIIEGFEDDPGLIPRWEFYAPWLDQPWVHKIRYEDAILDHKKAAEDVTNYIILRTANHHGNIPVVFKSEYDEMVGKACKLMSEPDKYSPTYRKGVSGEWKKEFTPRVLEAFERTGGQEWIEKLEYDGG